jgi:predicted transglutaminase-like cysteine proteinase
MQNTVNAIIATFLLVSLVTISGETNAFADAPAASAVISTTHDPAQGQAKVQVHDDGQAQEEVAALDLTEPLIKSPTPVESSIHSSTFTEPFGLNVVPVVSGDLLTKWNGVEADIRAESEILAHCRDGTEFCPSAARNFLAIIAEGRARTGRARIGVINRAINLAIRPMSDFAQWGVPDRWSAPLATLTTGRGDCEDYAIAKYVALRAAGIAEDDVRLVIVRDLAVGEDHAIVAARLDGIWIILDNRWLALVEDIKMYRAVPLFVLDNAGVKQLDPTTVYASRATAPHPHRSGPDFSGIGLADRQQPASITTPRARCVARVKIGFALALRSKLAPRCDASYL